MPGVPIADADEGNASEVEIATNDRAKGAAQTRNRCTCSPPLFVYPAPYEGPGLEATGHVSDAAMRHWGQICLGVADALMRYQGVAQESRWRHLST